MTYRLNLSKNNSHHSRPKAMLLVSLAAAILTLSACGKKDEPPMETAPETTAQPSVEQAQAGTDVGVATDAPVMNDDVAVASANDGIATADGMNDDVAIASADDSDMMDGTESEEHISTY